MPKTRSIASALLAFLFFPTGTSIARSLFPTPKMHVGVSPWSIVAAVLNGEKTTGHVTGSGIPKQIVTDGPVVTKDNAAGMLWIISTTGCGVRTPATTSSPWALMRNSP